MDYEEMSLQSVSTTDVFDLPQVSTTDVFDLPQDILIHVVSFHDHPDTMEAAYVGRSFLAAVRRLALRSPGLRGAFREACRDCGRHERYCQCEERSKRIGAAYFSCVMLLVLLWMMYPFMK